MKKLHKYAVLLLAGMMVFLAISCNEDENHPQIPYAPINIVIDPNSTEYLELNTVGGWLYLIGQDPSRGVLVYRFSYDEFRAYERTCPYDPQKANSRIEVESSNITAIDSTCGSRFIITDGSPFSGPSHLSLKQYNTFYNGDLLYITN